ncbi:hypothetical protein LTR66_000157 [Elasticomyces elasticus]|nr:hypothetical protein LTR28_001366 [Elasticomyces elasticus]KAK5001119.1 hypothetical protein LTR66_000157 [Elasticomyces elasticus]
MVKTPARRSAIIVGAGVGGVATAARLARAGFEVTVLEKNSFTGGRCSLIHRAGHVYITSILLYGLSLKIRQRFDQGPSLVLLPDLFREAFRDLDTSLEAEGVELMKCEPNYNVWFEDGERFELSTDIACMKREVERWEGKDGFERYLAFLQEAHRHYEGSVTHVLKKNFTSVLSILRPSFLYATYSLHPFESLYSRASKYFWTERLRRVFTFASMYMGMSPFDAIGTYSLLQYTELAEGIWYPRGGLHRVVSAFVRIGERYGVKYRLSSPVASITLSPPTVLKKGRTTGVTLLTGEKLFADIVVVNADLVYAYNNLLPPSSAAQRLSTRAASCSSISFYWAMDRQIPGLTTHNIFLAGNYRESFDDIFREQMIPEQPSFYVNVPSRIDPTAAPNGKDTIVVLVPIGHLLDNSHKGRGLDVVKPQDWSEIVSKTRSTILSTICARTGCTKDLAQAIAYETVNTPQTWKEVFNLDRGAILGLSHSFFNVLGFRPKTRHPQFDGLFFVGASTHPGTGVPVCLAGAKITSEQILRSCGMSIPWDEMATRQGEQRQKKGKKVKEIDRLHALPVLSSLHLVALLLLSLLSILVYRFVMLRVPEEWMLR